MASLVDHVQRIMTGKGKYKPVQTEEVDNRRVSTTQERYTDNPDPEAAGLLSGESRAPVPRSARSEPIWEKEESGWCTCCGVNLPLKILGVVALLVFLAGSYKLLKWAFYEPPIGLERLPEFGTSLGCLSTPYLYNNTKQVLRVPMNKERRDHGVDIQGDAVGTITLAEDTTGLDTILYQVTLRSNDPAFLERSIISLPEPELTGKSLITIATPYTSKAHPNSCIRYDIKMFVPRSLKKLHITSHSLAHAQFDPHARIKLEELFVTLYTNSPNNLIQATTSVKADRMGLEVYRGWIVGDVSIVNETNIVTQRGDGVAHVNVYPEPPKDERHPQVALLETATGEGRTDIFYHANKGVKRPIDSMHISAKNGNVFLTYQGAKFSGLVNLEAKSSNTTGVERLGSSEGQGQWTHYAGSKGGQDKMYVNSRGWVGLYL